MMDDWKVSTYTDPASGVGTWVYYENPNFPKIHMSRNVDNPNNDHTATDDRTGYYYGVTKTFNNAGLAAVTKTNLQNAWKDYFTV